MKRGFLFVSIFFSVLISLSMISAFDWGDGTLERYYKFDEGSGVVKDELNNYNASNTGATNTTGIINSAYFYEGLDDINATPYTFTNNVSMSMWINATDLSTRNEIWAIGISTVNEYIEVNETGFVKYVFGPASANNNVFVSHIPITANTWNHIVVNGSGTGVLGNYKIWINGVESEMTFGPNAGGDRSRPTGNYVMYFSKGLTTLPQFKGEIDEFSKWNRFMTQTDINDLYNFGKGLTYQEQPGPSPLNITIHENLNVTNNATIGGNLTVTSYGFFGWLGSSVSRIVKGWFTEIDAVNITSENINVNGTVVCLKDGTNCQADVEIKSGFDFVVEDSCTSITFNTAFSSTPVAVGNVKSDGEGNAVSIGSLSTSGFDLCLKQLGGGGGNYTVYWTATNAGNS